MQRKELSPETDGLKTIRRTWNIRGKGRRQIEDKRIQQKSRLEIIVKTPVKGWKREIRRRQES